MLAMNKDIKKLLVCGASLMMVASLGVGTTNASAHRVHHHSRRTALVSRKRTSVYKSNTTKRRAQYKAVKSYLNWIAKYDKSHSKKLNSYKLRHLNRYMNYLTFSQKKAMFNQLSRIQKSSAHVHKSHLIYKALTNRKHTRRARKYNKRHVAKHYRKVRRVIKRHGHVQSSRFDVTTPKIKHVNKKVSHVRTHKSVVTPKVNNVQQTTPNTTPSVQKSTSITTNKVANNTPTQNQSQTRDETDGGKYYSWNQLQNVLGSDDVLGGFESKATDDKIKNTLYYNLTKWNYSNKQLDELQNDSYIQQYDPYMMASANAEESINNLP